jgi:hypothetical protein
MFVNIDGCRSQSCSSPTRRAASSPPGQTIPFPASCHELAIKLKALSDPVRLPLLSVVASHAGGEACVCELLNNAKVRSAVNQTVPRSNSFEDFFLEFNKEFVTTVLIRK